MTSHPPIVRAETGVPGLDILLGGGLVKGGLYLIEGAPGAGKTVLATQIGFHFARSGQNVVFITLIAESHGKLIRHMSGFDFFDSRIMSKQVKMFSGFSPMLEDGLDALPKFLAETLHVNTCDLLILDGFAAARDFAGDTRSLARFIHQLNTLVGSLDVTALLLAPMDGNGSHPEHTLVDGLIELKRVACGLRRAREIEVHKMRGGAHVTGQHLFEINSGGIHVYPRFESLPVTRDRSLVADKKLRLSTGVPSLDAVLGGGLVSGSATSLLGAPGVGKTLLGLSFLANSAREGRKSLYFGFYESPERLQSKARSVGMDLQPLLAAQTLQLEWQPSLELFLDGIAEKLLRIVRERGIEAVFLDGAEGLAQASFYSERMPQFLTALTTHLRFLGVTTLLAEELPLFTRDIESKAYSLSAMVENVLLLRFFEYESQLRRLLSVIKLRDSDFDPSIREFVIGSTGLELRQQILGVEQVLLGEPHAVALPGTRAAPSARK